MEEKYNFREYIVRSMRLAGYLMYVHGCVLVSVEKDRDSSRNLFRFNNSEMLREKIELYKELKK